MAPRALWHLRPRRGQTRRRVGGQWARDRALAAGAGTDGHVAGATALFWIWQLNPYSVLTYQDALLYPFRRAALADKQGQAFIAQGTDLFRAKKYHEAANLLRLGLGRYPRDLRAQLLLAEYYLLTNQHPIALKILQDGLANDYPSRSYLDTLISVAEQGEDFGLAIQFCDRYLSRLKGDAAGRDYRWFTNQKFAALCAAGRHAEALAAAEAAEPGGQANEHRVLALLALKRAADAAAFLAEWQERPGADWRTVARLQVRALREAQLFEAMEAALAELRTLSPADPATLVYAVVQQALAGRKSQAARALADYLFRFGGSAANLILVAEPLAEIDQVALLRRCVTAATERGYSLQRFQALLVTSHLRHAEWSGDARRSRATNARGIPALAAVAHGFVSTQCRHPDAGRALRDGAGREERCGANLSRQRLGAGAKHEDCGHHRVQRDRECSRDRRAGAPVWEKYFCAAAGRGRAGAAVRGGGAIDEGTARGPAGTAVAARAGGRLPVEADSGQLQRRRSGRDHRGRPVVSEW